MQNDLIHAAAKLFPTYEHWRSFQELANNMDAVRDQMFAEATDRIRQHFKNTLSPEWSCESFGNQKRDTCWYLREYGPESLGLRFWCCYRFDLWVQNTQRFNSSEIDKLIKECAYLPIKQAFGRIDRSYQNQLVFMELQNFLFGNDQDGSFSERDLAWFAAHEIESFVEQAIAKVEKFTNNPQVTELLRKINQIAMEAAKGEQK